MFNIGDIVRIVPNTSKHSVLDQYNRCLYTITHLKPYLDGTHYGIQPLPGDNLPFMLCLYVVTTHWREEDLVQHIPLKTSIF